MDGEGCWGSLRKKPAIPENMKVKHDYSKVDAGSREVEERRKERNSAKCERYW